MTESILISVEVVADVVDTSGSVVGHLHPGEAYVARELGEPWVVVDGPEGARVFVARSVVQRLEGASASNRSVSRPTPVSAGPVEQQSSPGGGASPREEARAALVAAVGRFGPGLADDPRRVEAVLRDMAGWHKGEITALSAAAVEGVGPALLGMSPGTIHGLAARLAQMLERDRAVAPEMARWAVESWAIALGVDVSEPVPSTETVPVGDQATRPVSDPSGPATTPVGVPTQRAAPEPAAEARREPGSVSPAKRRQLVPMLFGAAVFAGVIGVGAFALVGGGNDSPATDTNAVTQTSAVSATTQATTTTTQGGASPLSAGGVLTVTGSTRSLSLIVPVGWEGLARDDNPDLVRIALGDDPVELMRSGVSDEVSGNTFDLFPEPAGMQDERLAEILDHYMSPIGCSDYESRGISERSRRRNSVILRYLWAEATCSRGGIELRIAYEPLSPEFYIVHQGRFVEFFEQSRNRAVFDLIATS